MGYDVCDDFTANEAWMQRSGNMCWGMGAGSHIPCLNCGAEEWEHRVKQDFKDIELKQ
jgi:hypothetical protein